MSSKARNYWFVCSVKNLFILTVFLAYDSAYASQTTDLSNIRSLSLELKIPFRTGLLEKSAQSNEIQERLPRPINPKPEGRLEQDIVSESEATSDRFILTGVEIEGSSLFSAAEFAKYYENFLVQTISYEQVTLIVEDITQMYRDRGYFLSRAIAPAQDTSGGILKLQIIEGYVDDIQFSGYAPAALRRKFQAILSEKPLRLATLDRTLALVERLNGVEIITTRITPHIEKMDLHNLEVELVLDRARVSIYTDNRGTEYAGEIQSYIEGAVNSVVRQGDQLSLGVFTIPNEPNELLLGEIKYEMPLNEQGTYASLSGLLSRFDAGASLAAFDIESRTNRISGAVSHAIIRRRKKQLVITASFETQNVRESQFDTDIYEDHLRIARLSVDFQQNHTNGFTSVSTKISRGLNVLGASDGQTPLSRADADGQFTKIEGEISRLQNLKKGFAVFTAFAGQSSTDPLLASEEFSLGGARFGRAYDYSELTGDHGIASQIELRFDRISNLPILDFYQLYGFYDFGAVWNENVDSEFNPLTLMSAGAGFRLTLPKSMYATYEAAKPLNLVPFSQDNRDWRHFFSVSVIF